jgi:F-type H+-transporting ATPase subunit b
MDLVTPDIGLIFWTTVSFAILYFILAKFAWKPILGAVNEREKSIKDALSAAEMAKEEMASLKADNEKKILNEAKLQRESLLKEAREIRSRIIADAESEATEKANKLIQSAKTAIENEKSAAMKELNNTVVDLSLNIAEKLLSKELDNKEKQQENIQEILENTKLN